MSTQKYSQEEVDKLLSSQRQSLLEEINVEIVKGITKWAEMAFTQNWINLKNRDGSKLWEDSQELEASLQTYILEQLKESLKTSK